MQLSAGVVRDVRTIALMTVFETIEIADLALLRGTGARGLRAILEEVLLNVMYEVPSRTDVAKVVITGEVVRERVNPTLVPRGAPKRAPREKTA